MAVNYVFSFCGGVFFCQKSYVVAMLCFSLFLQAYLIDFNTAVTTFWQQSKTQSYNDSSFVLGSLF